MAAWYARVPILAGLNERALAFLAEKALVQTFEPGSYVFREGEDGHSFFLIETGSVEVIEALGTPYEKSLAVLPAGDFFGEMAILECSKRSASIRVRETAVLHELTGGDLYHLFQAQPDQYAILILNIARDLARRLRRLDREFVLRSD